MPPPTPPSHFLPPLGRDLSKHTSQSLLDHVHILGKIFLPPILGSGTEQPQPQPSASTATPDHRTPAELSLSASKSTVTPEDEDEYEVLRNDEYEQGCARGWLVKIVKRGEEWIEEVEDEGEEVEERLRREEVVEGAAALLAIWSGTSAAGAILRTLNLPREIVLNINDAAYSSQSPDSVGVQTWGSSILFARRIASSPCSFGLLPSSSQRILELGAGTGVVAMTIAALPFPSPPSPSTTTSSLPYPSSPTLSPPPSLPEEANPRRLILATDHHPLVLTNLRSNVNLNFPASKLAEDPRRKVEVHGLDWLQFHEGEYEETVGRDGARKKSDVARVGVLEEPFDERFDLIFGADIVYEAHHAPWIFDTVSHFLAHPHFPTSSSQPSSYDTFPLCSSLVTYLPSFHLWAPLRPTHTAEIDSIEATFPLGSSLEPRGGRSPEELAWRLAVVEEEKLVRVEGVGRKDEVMYRRWRIAWV